MVRENRGMFTALRKMQRQKATGPNRSGRLSFRITIFSRLATALMHRNPALGFRQETLKNQVKYSRSGVSQTILRRVAGSGTHSVSQSMVCW